MGCINNIKIKDKKYTPLIVSNKCPNDVSEKRKYSHQLKENIYSKRNFEDTSKANISQTKSIAYLIENNPLEFVKIKPKKYNL